MPIYEAELHDGRKVTLESDHPPTEDEILAAAGQWEKENTPGAAGTFARSAATSIVPGLGTAGGAAMGAELGAAGGPIGILAGGAIGALVGGIAASRAQRKLLKIAVPDFLADTERGAAAHPGAAFAGDVAGALPVFEFNPTAAIRGAVSIPAVLRGTATTAQQKLAKAAAIQTGMGVGFGVVNPLLEGQAPTGTGVAESAGMALLLGHPRAKMFRPTVPQFLRKGAPDASSQQEAAALHGDVRTQQEPTRVVPQQEGRPGVQPQTQGVAQEAQVPLTEEQRVPRITGNEEGGFTLELHGKKESGFQTEAEAKMAALQVIAGEREMQDEGKPMSREALKEKDKQRAKSKEQQEADEIFDEAIDTANNAANELGKKTQIVDEDKYGGEVPFAPGEFMKPAGDTVLISKQQFRTWLIKEVLEGGASRKRIMESVARRINEEHEHQRVINAFGDQVNEKMADYWNSMTGFEKGVTNLQYHGDWKGNPKYTPALMGHEAVRQRLQRLSGTTSEITQAVGLERWSLKTLNVLSDMVRFARERVGTEASAKQREVWDNLQKNLDLAMKMVQGPPAAKRRKGMSVAEELKANLEAAKKHAEFIANQYAVNAQEKQQVRDNLIKAWKDAIFYHVTGKAPPKEGPPDQQTPAAIRRDKSKNLVERLFVSKTINPNQVLNTLQNKLHPDEWKALKDAGIEKWRMSDKADTMDIANWIEENGPRIKITKLPTQAAKRESESKVAKRRELNDTLGDLNNYFAGQWETTKDGSIVPISQGLFGRPPAEMMELVNRYNKLVDDVGRDYQILRQRMMRITHELDTDLPDWRDYMLTGGWQDDPEIPDAVKRKMIEVERLDYAMEEAPADEEIDAYDAGYTASGVATPKPATEMSEPVDILINIPVESPKEFSSALDFERMVKYRAPHYEGKGQNLVGHVRGYMERTPDGKKVFHVIEVQSDWARSARQQKEYLESADAANPTGWGTDDMKKFVKESPSLLRHYERLALKAAIDHARESGADAIAISDGPTAWMTQGHGSQKTMPGMKLHYDNILPKIASELTGKPGVPVDFGLHQYANPSVSPKRNVTARMFPIDQARQEFSLFDKDIAAQTKPAAKRRSIEDEIREGPPMAPQPGDYEKYQQLQQQLREYNSRKEWPPPQLFKEIETIKNRNGGMPPKGETPAAKRRGDDFEALPADLAYSLWNAAKKGGDLVDNAPLDGDTMLELLHHYAISPEDEWHLPEGVKDQLHTWFRNNQGGKFDRTHLITQKMQEMIKEPTNNEEHLIAQNAAMERLWTLRANVRRAEKSAPEDYTPAAKRRDNTPEKLMDLSGARNFIRPETIEQKQKLEEQLAKRGVVINGHQYPHNSAYGYAAGEILIEGKAQALKYAQWAVDDVVEGGYPAGAGKRVWLERILEATKDLVADPRVKISLGSETPFPGWKDETQLRLDLPSAKMRKRPQPYDPEQTKMFSSEMTAKGIPGAEDVPPEERTTATQAGAPSALEASLPIKRMEEVYKEVAKPKPSFRAFTDWFYKNSTATRAEMARDWENAVWHHLLSADGARLQELRKNYQLESRLGSRDIADRPDKLSPQQTLELKSSGTAIGREDFRKAGVAAQKYRYKVISELATRMINQARDRAKALTRKEVTLDDVDFTNARAETGAYHVFSKEGDSEQVIRRVLTNRARPSKFDKLSVTKRLAVLIDDAGKVHVVDVYNSNAEPTKRSLELPADLKPRGIDGLMVYDPQGTTVRGRPHVSLKTALEKNRLYASILIDDPVKDFHQVYDSLRDFEERFGQEAASRETIAEQDFATQGWNPDAEGIDEEVDEIRSAPEGMSAEEYEAGETPPKMSPPRAQEVQDVEAAEEPPSSQVMRGEGGSVTGPSAGAARASMGSMRRGGELERSRYMPMTTPEALAVHSQFVEEIGQLNSPEDIENLITGFIDLHKRGQLRGQQRQALSAITKAAQHYADELYEARGKLTSKDPNYESDERITELAYEKALDHFYEAARISKDRNQYLQIALQPFSKGTLESLPPQVTPETRYSPVRRPELVRATRYGDVRRLEPYNPERISQEFIGPTRAPELTTGNPGVIPGPEKLPNSVLEAISQKPLVDEKGRVIEPKSSEAVGIDITKTKPTGKVSEFPPPEFRTQSGYLGPRKAKMPKFGGKGQGDFDLPAARVRRTTESLSDDLAKIKNAIVNFHKRQGSFRDLNSLADGANRSSEEAAIKQSNDIRLASLDKEVATLMESHGLKDLFDRPEAKQVRRAVKAFLAAFQDAEDREWLRISDEWHDIRARAAEAKRKHEKWELDPKDVPVWTKPTDVTALNFEKMILNADKGIAKAKDMLKSPNRETRKIGEKYLAGAEELKADAIWARDNLNSEPLRRTVKMYQDVMQEHLENLLMNGFNIASRDYYVPGRYDGEMWDDGMFTWGDMRVLGGQQRMPKVFRNYYEAIATGPYIPVNGDIAALAQHSIATGMRMINERAWLESTKTMIDPVSKKPIGISPVAAKVGVMVENPETGVMEKQSTLEWQVPAKHQDYELVYPSGRKSVPIAIRRGYVQAVKGVLAQSEVPNMPGGKELLRIAQMLKHGVILLLDTFHPGRLLQYGASLGGKEWTNVGRRGAWSALNFNPESLPDAVKRGLISQEAADWAMTKVKVRDGGRLREITRHQLASEFLHNGLNATQIADVFYRNAIQKIPVIGERWHQLINPINRWTFDRITPGLIMENAILSLERINKSSPNRRLDAQMRDIARDINAYFGNMGRQGLFKNPTFRDLSQIFVLAPMWQEGLFRKEITALSRVSGLSWALGRRGMGAQAYFGPIGYGIAKGLASYFVLTQAINLITRRKFTWDNPEDDHKMDAWFTLPWMGEGKGVWVSPFSVFGEVGHDFMRLYETKGTTFAALTRLGENKLGPWGRVAGIIHDSKTPSGQQITSDVGMGKAIAGELGPLPISLAPPIRGLAHAVAPGAVAPNRPNVPMQRALSMVGIKTMTPTRPEQDIARMAAKFTKDNNLKFEPMVFTPTDEASYSKLRGAIRNEDWSGAQKLLADLRKHRTDQQIIHAMKLASQRPFTGSKQAEKLFLYSLSNRELDMYYAANLDRADQYQKFVDFFLR